MAALKVRPALPGDADVILELHHRHGKEFYVPDPAAPDNMVACIVEDETGLVVGAGILHVTVEGHFLLDKTWGTPAERWKLARVILEEGFRFARLNGFRDVMVATPRIFRGFARRLAGLAGFVSDEHREHFKVLLDRRFIV